MRRKFGKIINQIAKNDDKVVLLVGDIGYGIFDDFRKDYRPPVKELDSILKSPEEKHLFIPSQHFTGQREGYVFKKGRHGNGYYLDRHVRFNL